MADVAQVDPSVLSNLTTQMVGTLNKQTSQLADIAAVAQQNFITMQKVVDYSYLQERNMVSLPEALGAREVGSKEVPAGPNTVAAK